MEKNLIFTIVIEAKTKRERIKMAWEILKTGKVSTQIPRDQLKKEGIVK